MSRTMYYAVKYSDQLKLRAVDRLIRHRSINQVLEEVKTLPWNERGEVRKQIVKFEMALKSK